jgi:hypothetical protein
MRRSDALGFGGFLAFMYQSGTLATSIAVFDCADLLVLGSPFEVDVGADACGPETVFTFCFFLIRPRPARAEAESVVLLVSGD